MLWRIDQGCRARVARSSKARAMSVPASWHDPVDAGQRARRLELQIEAN